MHARTLTIFRLYQLFNGIIFTGPVWAVYLLSRGLTLTQFGLVEAALHVGMLVAQVPTGALADALGRRRLLVAAGFFTAVGELGYVYAPGFGLICLAGAIHGVAFALRTGADEAYLFDALAHDDAQAQFPRMLGGLWAVFQFATAISFLAGGLIATWSRPAAFWLTAICALIASGIASRLPDDARGSAGQGLSVARSGLCGASPLAAAGGADDRLEHLLGGLHQRLVLRRAAVRRNAAPPMPCSGSRWAAGCWSARCSAGWGAACTTARRSPPPSVARRWWPRWRWCWARRCPAWRCRC